MADTTADATSEPTFPVLQPILEAYLPNPANESAPGDDQLLADYAKHGEDAAQFSGLLEDLGSAIRRPQEAADMVNEVLGTAGTEAELDRIEVRRLLAELKDCLSAAHDDVASAAPTTPTAPTARQLVDHAVTRRVRLPLPWLRERPVPLWLVLVAGFIIGLAGVLLGRLDLPSVLALVPALLAGVGLAVVGVTAYTMSALESELTKPDKLARRRQRRDEAEAKRSARRGSNWLSSRI